MIVHHAPIVLASRSPRRKELLETAGIQFSIEASRVRESDFPRMPPEQYVAALARAKAADISQNHPRAWVIGADCVVFAKGRILEKPESVSAARQMMRLLGGASHFVFTGYCITCRHQNVTVANTVKTEVVFKPLTDAEIEWYIETPEPYDKAGGYAIQGLGGFMVKRIIGSYTNVVGLPLCEVLEDLTRLGVIERRPGIRMERAVGENQS